MEEDDTIFMGREEKEKLLKALTEPSEPLQNLYTIGRDAYGRTTFTRRADLKPVEPEVRKKPLDI